MSSNRHREQHALSRASKTLTHAYTLWLRFADATGEKKIECEVLTMGEYGLLEVGKKLVDVPVEHAEKPVEDMVFIHNTSECERAKAEALKWEERLIGSPLDLTQQNHVAYYRDLLPLFEEWFAQIERS